MIQSFNSNFDFEFSTAVYSESLISLNYMNMTSDVFAVLSSLVQFITVNSRLFLKFLAIHL